MIASGLKPLLLAAYTFGVGSVLVASHSPAATALGVGLCCVVAVAVRGRLRALGGST